MFFTYSLPFLSYWKTLRLRCLSISLRTLLVLQDREKRRSENKRGVRSALQRLLPGLLGLLKFLHGLNSLIISPLKGGGLTFSLRHFAKHLLTDATQCSHGWHCHQPGFYLSSTGCDLGYRPFRQFLHMALRTRPGAAIHPSPGNKQGHMLLIPWQEQAARGSGREGALAAHRNSNAGLGQVIAPYHSLPRSYQFLRLSGWDFGFLRRNSFCWEVLWWWAACYKWLSLSALHSWR